MIKKFSSRETTNHISACFSFDNNINENLGRIQSNMLPGLHNHGSHDFLQSGIVLTKDLR